MLQTHEQSFKNHSGTCNPTSEIFTYFSGVNSTFPASGIFLLIIFLGVISTFCQNLEVGGRIPRVAHLPGELMTSQRDQTPVAIFT